MGSKTDWDKVSEYLEHQADEIREALKDFAFQHPELHVLVNFRDYPTHVHLQFSRVREAGMSRITALSLVEVETLRAVVKNLETGRNLKARHVKLSGYISLNCELVVRDLEVFRLNTK